MAVRSYITRLKSQALLFTVICLMVTTFDGRTFIHNETEKPSIVVHSYLSHGNNISMAVRSYITRLKSQALLFTVICLMVTTFDGRTFIHYETENPSN